MLHLNSKVDRPDFAKFRREVESVLEKTGIQLKDSVQEKYREVVEKHEYLKKSIEYRYGMEDLASPVKLKNYLLSLNNKAIADAIFDKKTKKHSTNKEALNKLVALNFQLGEDILAYRNSDSIRKAFKKLVESLDENNKIRPQVVFTETNRLIYEKPGLMNIAKDVLRETLIAPEKDEFLVSVDVKSQEPLIVANMLGIADLIGLEDFYETVVEKATGLKSITEKQRQQIKGAHNAIAYGAGEKEIIRICKNLDGKKIYDFYNSFKEFKEHKKKCEHFARRGVKTSFTLFDTEITSAGYGYLVGTLMNAPMQGTASDINCLLALNFLENKPEGMEMYFPRVDEVIIRVKNNIENYEEILLDLFEHQVDDWKPFHVKVQRLGA